MRLGKSFSCKQAATAQRALICLLDASPLPWTWDMLISWFGDSAHDSIVNARMARRIWRPARGCYTANRRYASPVVTVSSALMERRFGIRC